jgi:hypothetical protein
VCSFKPQLTEECVVYGPDGQAVGSTYTLHCTQGSENCDVTLESGDLLSERARHAAFVRPDGGLSKNFQFDDGRLWDVWQAGKQFGGELVQTSRYAMTGWAANTASYILPETFGAITAGGSDGTFLHNGFKQHLPEIWKLYGLGVRPVTSADDHASASAALADLFVLQVPSVIVPLLDGIFGATLLSIGLNSSLPIIHFWGRTGMFKTSTVLASMSLVGQFRRAPTETWKSTPGVIQQRLHTARDLPLLVDDFRPSDQRAAALGQIIQSYGDRVARSRLGEGANRQKAAETYTPYALMISTGEDRLQEAESAAARVFNIAFPEHPHGSPELKDRLRRLKRVQEHASRGALGLVGGTWLQYIARRLEKTGRDRFAAQLEEVHQEELTKLGDLSIHARVIDTLGTLRVIERLVLDFLSADFVTFAPRWARLCTDYWTAQERWLVDEAQEAQERTPVRIVFGAINESFEEVQFQRIDATDFHGSITGTIVGFFDDEWLYFSENTTMRWFRQWSARQHVDVPFTWTQFREGLINEYGGEPKELQLSKPLPPPVGSKHVRTVRIPKEAASIAPR